MSEGLEETAGVEMSGHGFEWLLVPLRFLVHAITGTLIFLVIAGFAVGLDLLISYLGTQGVGLVVLYGLKFAKYSLFLADLVLFARFVWKAGQRAWSEM